MKQIPPLLLRPGYWREVEKEINRIFLELIYKPLRRVMAEPHPEYFNAMSSLLDAVRGGIVWYQDGHFYGQFNAKISADLRSIGALYSTRSKTWGLALEICPPDIRVAQARADSRYDALRRGFLQTLADINPDMIEKLSSGDQAYRSTLSWMDEDFKRSVRAISIPPQLTEAQRDILAKDWNNNLNLYIKKWTQENTLKLRDEVQAHVFAGNRISSLSKLVHQNYEVSRAKARFLARQETSLLLSKFRETRYSDVGVQRYKWSTSHDERVRSDHKHLNGKIFSFSEPPVTNKDTGARNNPGEDFGCRCVAIGIVE